MNKSFLQLLNNINETTEKKAYKNKLKYIYIIEV